MAPDGLNHGYAGFRDFTEWARVLFSLLFPIQVTLSEPQISREFF